MSIDDSSWGTDEGSQPIAHTTTGSSPHSTTGDPQSSRTRASRSLAVIRMTVGSPATPPRSRQTCTSSPSGSVESATAQLVAARGGGAVVVVEGGGGAVVVAGATVVLVVVVVS